MLYFSIALSIGPIFIVVFFCRIYLVQFQNALFWVSFHCTCFCCISFDTHTDTIVWFIVDLIQEYSIRTVLRSMNEWLRIYLFWRKNKKRRLKTTYLDSERWFSLRLTKTKDEALSLQACVAETIIRGHIAYRHCTGQSES